MAVVQAIAKVNDRYLLVHEKNGSWHIPSGRLEFGESLAQAIIREVKEETGAVCELTALFKIKHSYHISEENGVEVQSIGTQFLFEIKTISEIVNNENEYTLGAGWFSREEMKKIKLRTPKMLKHVDHYEKRVSLEKNLPMEFVITSNAEKS